MAVRIRMSRVGRKNTAAYRIAVYDAHTRRDGRYLEELGTYNPYVSDKANKVKLNAERYQFWVKQGALPTESLGRLLKHSGLIS